MPVANFNHKSHHDNMCCAVGVMHAQGQASSKGLEVELLRKKLSAADSSITALRTDLAEAQQEATQLRQQVQAMESDAGESQAAAEEQVQTLCCGPAMRCVCFLMPSELYMPSAQLLMAESTKLSHGAHMDRPAYPGIGCQGLCHDWCSSAPHKPFVSCWCAGDVPNICVAALLSSAAERPEASAAGQGHSAAGVRV